MLASSRPASVIARLLDESAEPFPETGDPWADLPDDAPASGARFGGYTLLGEIARGGMGVVSRARQEAAQRIVALKTIAPALAAEPGARERFRREAEAAAALDHPNILPIYEVGEVSGVPFFSMKLAEGGNLAASPTTDPRAAATLVARLARAVQHAHERGILHRDLKPANVLLDANGTPYVADFGLARFFERTDDPTLTLTGLGTPQYVSPEQARGDSKTLTTATDVYSLGAILYAQLTGRPPASGETALETLRLVIERVPTAPRTLNPDTPRDLEIVCLKCLQKTAADRYPSAGALADDLESFLAGRSISARPATTPERLLRWAAANRALAAALAVLLMLLTAVAIGSSVAAVRFREATRRALAAEADGREKLRASYLAQADASRRTGRVGQRNDALEAAAKAARLRPGLDARNAAIAALGLADFAVERAWKVRPAPNLPLAFDAPLERYAVETEPGLIALRRVADETLLGTLAAPAGSNPKAVFLTPFTADGRWLAVRHANGALRVWDVSGTPRLAWELSDRPTGGVNAFFALDAAFRPDGKVLAVGLPAGGCTFHDVETGAETGRLSFAGAPSAVAFDPSGARLAWTVKGEKTVQIADLKAGAVLHTLTLPEGIIPLAWSPDGRTLAVGCLDHSITLWDTSTGRRRAILSGHRQPPTQLLFHPSGRGLVSTGIDKTVRLWDPRAGVALMLATGLGAEPALRLSPDGRHLALTDFGTGARLAALAWPAAWRVLRGPAAGERAGLVAGIDFSPDGRLIATAGVGAVRVFDLAGETEIALPEIDPGREKSVRFTPDGRALLIGSRTQALSRLTLVSAGARVEFGARELLVPGADELLNSLSADGHSATFSSRVGGQSRVVSLLRPDVAGPTFGPQPEVWLAELSPNGLWLVTTTSGYGTSAADQGRVWDTGTGRVAHELGMAAGGLASFSPDGRWLIAHGSAGSRIWQTGTWQPGPSLPPEIDHGGNTSSYSPDGSLLAVTVNETVRLVRAADGTELAALDPPLPMNGARTRWSPDSRLLALHGTDGSLQLWDITALRAELREQAWETDQGLRQK